MSLSEVHRRIVETAKAVVYVRDRNRKILYINPAAEALCGWTASEAVGIACYNVFGDAQQSCRAVCPLDRVFDGRQAVVHHEVILTTRSGENRNMRVALSPLVENGAVVAAVVVMDDITALRNVEQTNLKTVVALEQEIARREQTERVLLETEEKLKGVLASMDDLVFTLDASGHFVDHYQPARDPGDFYARPEEFLGKSFKDVLPPDVVEVIRHAIEKVSTTGEVQEVDYRIDLPAGRSWFSAKISARRDCAGNVTGITAVCRNITARKELERSLRARERFLEDVFASIQDGVCVLNRDLTIVRTNRALEQWYADSMPLVGKRCFEVYQNRGTPCDPCPSLRAMEAGSLAHDKVPFTAANGERVGWLELYAHPFLDEESGKVTGVIEIVRDITDRVRADDRLLQTKKLEAIGTLAGGVAHDINNVLAVVLGFGSTLQHAMHPGDPHLADVNEIVAAARRGRGLVQNLLGFARKGSRQRQRASLNDVVGELVEVLLRSLSKRIAISTALAEDLTLAEYDPSQMAQVLMNVCLNARDALDRTAEGHIVISTENVSIPSGDILELAPGRYVKMAVKDNGPGMNERTKARVFEPFFTTKDVGKGTGLGLSMAYGIVQEHDGAILLDSRVGDGTTVSILLPAAAAVEADQAQGSQQASPPVSTALKAKILVVDDEQMFRIMGKRLLSIIGYDVLTADCCDGAVALYRNSLPPIDLILLDLCMPVMSGSECFDKLHDIDPDVAVLVCTGHDRNEEADALVAKGALGVLRKPFEFGELADTVKAALVHGTESGCTQKQRGERST